MRLDQHPKNCPCGCDQTFGFLDWLLLVLLIALAILLIKAVFPPRPVPVLSMNAPQPVYTTSYVFIDGKMIEID